MNPNELIRAWMSLNKSKWAQTYKLNNKIFSKDARTQINLNEPKCTQRRLNKPKGTQMSLNKLMWT